MDEEEIDQDEQQNDDLMIYALGQDITNLRYMQDEGDAIEQAHDIMPPEEGVEAGEEEGGL